MTPLTNYGVEVVLPGGGVCLGDNAIQQALVIGNQRLASFTKGIGFGGIDESKPVEDFLRIVWTLSSYCNMNGVIDVIWTGGG